jgi:hypothetical protein
VAAGVDVVGRGQEHLAQRLRRRAVHQEVRDVLVASTSAAEIQIKAFVMARA